MKQPEHKSIEGLREVIKSIIFNEESLRYTTERDKKWFDKRLDNYVEMLKPHLNSRNLLERFVEFLHKKNFGYDMGSVHKDLNVTDLLDIDGLLDEFLESELNERKPE